jgi:DNA-binding transcriptional LysR family regulator
VCSSDLPADLLDSLEITPYAEDELALILPTSHPLAQVGSLPIEELYKLQFITLDSQSTIRKAIDRVLLDSGVDPRQLTIAMELNSIEAIKNAVQAGLGAAFLSVTAIEKELQMGALQQVRIDGVVIKRMLLQIRNPNRYRSKATEAFCNEVLPFFRDKP